VLSYQVFDLCPWHEYGITQTIQMFCSETVTFILANSQQEVNMCLLASPCVLVPM